MIPRKRTAPVLGLVVGVLAAVGGLYAAVKPEAPRLPQALATPTAPALAPTEPSLRDRAAFARRLARVQEGMARERVRKLPGEPDDVWAGDEVRASRLGFVYPSGVETWAYGGEGHLTFPTLGRVTFDSFGKVVEVLGHGERLPGKDLPPERETRRILRLIDRLKGYDHRNDPLRVIQVVNGLQPLGKSGGLAVIDEYLRVADQPAFGGGRDGLFVVVRCLFEIPRSPGHLPPMVVGLPHPDAPKHLRFSPRFPVVLHRDIPFSGINGYSLAGVAEMLEWHLEPYRRWGRVRSQPLRPPDNPLEVIESMVASPEWPDWGSEEAWGRSIARDQALRLVAPVYPVAEDEWGQRLTGSYENQEPQWRSHLHRFGAIKARWDPVRNTYVRPDGTSVLAQPETYSYPRTWLAPSPNGNVEVALHRVGRWVNVSLGARGATPPMPRLRLFLGATEIRNGSDLRVPQEGGFFTGFAVPEGSDIRLVLELGGKSVAETVLRP